MSVNMFRNADYFMFKCQFSCSLFGSLAFFYGVGAGLLLSLLNIGIMIMLYREHDGFKE